MPNNAEWRSIPLTFMAYQLWRGKIDTEIYGRYGHREWRRVPLNGVGGMAVDVCQCPVVPTTRKNGIEWQ